MTTIPLLFGAYATAAADFRTALPVNLEPIVGDNGIARGYLRAAPGLTAIGAGPGQDRGAINWNGTCYRVMGDQLVAVSGSSFGSLGSVLDGGPVSLDYSFDRLAIASAGNLYYYKAGAITQVTDPDLGVVIDMLFIAGYFMTTDGTSLVVTELANPYAVDPLKYGSSEEDPDPVVALKKVRGEVYALNRYTIENFQNVGGNGFPFTRNQGAIIPKGCVGTHACGYFLETFAFVGSGRGEALSVYLAGPGTAQCISTPEIDTLLAGLSDTDQAAIEMDTKVEKNEQRLYIHLPSQTLVYSHQATQANKGAPVWHTIASGVAADQAFAARHFCLEGGQWIVGGLDGTIGYLDSSVDTHFGATAGWEFQTVCLYNEARGGIIKALELIGLPGRAPFGSSPTMMFSLSRDAGVTWSEEYAISQGAFGERGKRLQWRPKMRFSNYATMRFRGANTALASFTKLEADIEPLAA